MEDRVVALLTFLSASCGGYFCTAEAGRLKFLLLVSCPGAQILPCRSLKDPRNTVLEHRPVVWNLTVSTTGQGASGSETLTAVHLSSTQKTYTQRLLNEWLSLKQTASLKQKACLEREIQEVRSWGQVPHWMVNAASHLIQYIS